MGKFIKPEWSPRGKSHPMVWTGDFAYHTDDERTVRALVAQVSGAHTVEVHTKDWPEDEIVRGTWAYRARGAWRHDVSRILDRYFKVTTNEDGVEPGTVFLAATGERAPAE